jgi:hypothetical protein
VEASNDGRLLYVVNGKSPTGSDPKYFPKNSALENASNQYIEQLEKSSLLSFPIPDDQTLDHLTRTTAANNGLRTSILRMTERSCRSSTAESSM